MQETAASRRWRKIVEEHNASGQTMAAFAKSKDLKAGTLNWWRCRLRKLDREPANREPQFTELTVTSPATTVVLVLDDYKAHVVVDDDTDLVLLRRVLGAMT